MRAKQKGVVFPLLAVAMVVLVGMAGFALDTGHWMLSKSRVQNAVDAAALEGAKVLNMLGDLSSAEAMAVAQAAAVDAYSAALEGESGGAMPIVEFSDSLAPFTAGGTNPRFIRVRVEQMTLPMYLAQVVPGVANTKQLRASAVSGPIPTTCAGVDPIGVCATPADFPTLTNDVTCEEGPEACYGYTLGGSYNLKANAQTEESDFGPGNFMLLALDCTGAACLRDALGSGEQGTTACAGDDIVTEPGNTVGPVYQGVERRLSNDYYSLPLVSDDPLQEYANAIYGAPDGAPTYIRELRVPVVKCDPDNPVQGRADVEVGPILCFLITDQPSHSGATQTIPSVLRKDCSATANTNYSAPLDSMVNYRIVLYKDSGSGDS